MQDSTDWAALAQQWVASEPVPSHPMDGSSGSTLPQQWPTSEPLPPPPPPPPPMDGPAGSFEDEDMEMEGNNMVEYTSQNTQENFGFPQSQDGNFGQVYPYMQQQLQGAAAQPIQQVNMQDMQQKQMHEQHMMRLKHYQEQQMRFQQMQRMQYQQQQQQQQMQMQIQMQQHQQYPHGGGMEPFVASGQQGLMGGGGVMGSGGYGSSIPPPAGRGQGLTKPAWMTGASGAGGSTPYMPGPAAAAAAVAAAVPVMKGSLLAAPSVHGILRPAEKKEKKVPAWLREALQEQQREEEKAKKLQIAKEVKKGAHKWSDSDSDSDSGGDSLANKPPVPSSGKSRFSGDSSSGSDAAADTNAAAEEDPLPGRRSSVDKQDGRVALDEAALLVQLRPLFTQVLLEVTDSLMQQAAADVLAAPDGKMRKKKEGGGGLLVGLGSYGDDSGSNSDNGDDSDRESDAEGASSRGEQEKASPTAAVSTASLLPAVEVPLSRCPAAGVGSWSVTDVVPWAVPLANAAAYQVRMHIM